MIDDCPTPINVFKKNKTLDLGPFRFATKGSAEYFASVAKDVQFVDSATYRTKGEFEIVKNTIYSNILFDTNSTFTIKNNLKIFNSSFSSGVDFKAGSDKSGNVKLEDVNILGYLDLRKAFNLRSFSLDKCFIKGQLDFSQDSSVFSFWNRLHDKPNRTKAVVSLEGAIFCYSPDFSNAYFDSTLTFAGSSFYDKELVFNKTYFASAPNFEFVKVPSTIIFSDVDTEHWKNLIDFRTCRLSTFDSTTIDKCTIVFNYSKDFNFAKFDAAKFLIPADRFRLKFGDNFPSSQRLVVFETLSKNSKEVGMIKDSNEWNIQYQEYYNETEWLFLGKVMNKFQKYWWNFGYAKWRIVAIWMPFFFVFFWIINFLNIDRIATNVYNDPDFMKNQKFSKIKSTSDLTAQKDKLTYSFFLTATLYFGLKLNLEALNYRNMWGLTYICVLYLIGTFHVAYSIGYIIK